MTGAAIYVVVRYPRHWAPLGRGHPGRARGRLQRQPRPLRSRRGAHQRRCRPGPALPPGGRRPATSGSLPTRCSPTPCSWPTASRCSTATRSPDRSATGWEEIDPREPVRADLEPRRQLSADGLRRRPRSGPGGRRGPGRRDQDQDGSLLVGGQLVRRGADRHECEPSRARAHVRSASSRGTARRRRSTPSRSVDGLTGQAPAATVALTALTMRSRSASDSDGWTGREMTSRAACWVTGRSPCGAYCVRDASSWFGIG